METFLKQELLGTLPVVCLFLVSRWNIREAFDDHHDNAVTSSTRIGVARQGPAPKRP
jgi:hypothetical protein